MSSRIQLLSIDFDGTLVSHVGEPALNRQCVELIRELQDVGAIWAINTGRSVDLLESGLTNFEFQIRPDFILTTERDVFRRGGNGDKWEPFGDWNDRCARDHAELFSSAQPVLAEVIDFVTQETNARPEVQNAVRNAGGYVAQQEHGAGVYEALLHFTNGGR